ncbi:MAG: hypothetical protein WCP69_01260 [Bacteroidota bacterium]
MKQFVIFILIILPTYIVAQSSFREREIVADSTCIVFDTLSIIPNSLKISQNTSIIPDSLYNLNCFSSTICFKTGKYNGEKITLVYQVFNFNLTKPFFHKPISLIDNFRISSINEFANPNTNIQTGWFDNSSDLTKAGSITRGVSIGNKQDVVVNSDLNLQLDGLIFDDFYIKAVISDKNIPLQPEGNTQQLQEFDKVFIQLYNKIVKITAGDFDIVAPQSSFLEANKKVLGVNVDYQTFVADSNSFSTSTGFAMTKGKFTRMQVTPIEGNQGPYRMISENGEANIVIIGGSERVFFNGTLLQRGQNNDYTVDYNIGEIVFTSRVLIARESRIVVEFEYSDRHYSRSIASSFNQWKSEKFVVSLNLYSEQDLKNQSIQPELSLDQKNILRNAGEQFDQMVSPAFDSLPYNSNQIRYKLIDTIVSAVRYDTVFVYSTNPDSSFYALSFTYLGANKGDYLLLNNSANGRVFAWIAPLNGIKQGSYSPIVVLVPPQKKQMVVAKLDYKVSKNSLLNLEVAVSNFDKNLFSTIGNTNNLGGAIVGQFTNRYFFDSPDVSPKNKLVSKLGFELNSKTFSFIEPSKNSEFYRQLNIQSSNLQPVNMALLSADFLFEHQKKILLNYSVNYLEYQSQYKGIQQLWNGATNFKYFDLKSNGFYTNSTSSLFKSTFLKSNQTARLKLPFAYLGVQLETEKNMFIQGQDDSLMSNSLGLIKNEFFIVNSDSAKLKYKIWINGKTIENPLFNKMTPYSYTTETGVNFDLQSLIQNITVNAVYREVNYASHILEKNEYAFISNVNHQIKLAKSAVVINTYYQTATGREQKKEYQYIKVAKGQGQYLWTDFNNNNVEDLDEFSIAPYSDQGEYVRIWIISNEYVRTFANEFNQTMQINLSTLCRKKTIISKILSLLKNQSSILLSNKTSAGPEIGANPFVFDRADQNTVSAGRSLRNVFSINQSNPIWNVEYLYNNSFNKLFLVSGFETRNQTSNSVVIRFAPLRKFSQKIDIGLIDKSLASEYFDNRNYQIKQNYIDASISFLKSTNFRTSLSYRYNEKESSFLNEINTSFFNHATIDFQYNIPNKGMINTKVSMISVLFNQDKNSPLALEILEGLSNGFNLIGNMSFQTVIAKNLQLNLIYETRVSPDKTVVHTGNISIRANF